MIEKATLSIEEIGKILKDIGYEEVEWLKIVHLSHRIAFIKKIKRENFVEEDELVVAAISNIINEDSQQLRYRSQFIDDISSHHCSGKIHSLDLTEYFNRK